MISRDNPQNCTREVGTTATPILQVGMLRAQREGGPHGQDAGEGECPGCRPRVCRPIALWPRHCCMGWCSHGGLSPYPIGRDPLASLLPPPLSSSSHHQSHSYRSSRQVLWVYSEIQSFIPFRNARGSILYTVLYISFLQLKGRPNAYHVTGWGASPFGVVSG